MHWRMADAPTSLPPRQETLGNTIRDLVISPSHTWLEEDWPPRLLGSNPDTNEHILSQSSKPVLETDLIKIFSPPQNLP